MAKLTLNCPLCTKPLRLDHREKFGTEVIEYFECGHAFALGTLNTGAILAEQTYQDLTGSKKARAYQKQGVDFILGAGEFADFADVRGNSCILGDQMRLGKTPQALMALRALFETKQSLPALILVRAANVYQWMAEIKTWTTAVPNGVWLIEGTKSWIPEGFSIYLMSMDTFARRGTCKLCKHAFHDEDCKLCARKMQACRQCVGAGDAMSDKLLEFGFKVCIVDEAHAFKNTSSNRAGALTLFLKTLESSEISQDIPFTCMICKEQWCEKVKINLQTTDNTKRVSKTSYCPKCFATQSQSAALHVKVKRNCSIIFLSGTIIKNRADEFFFPLNTIDPVRFNSQDRFRHEFLVQDSKGKWAGVHPYKKASFDQAIAPYFLRREKEDVYTDLPKITRIFTPIVVADENLKKAYNAVLDEIEGRQADTGRYDFFGSIGELARLRQICGLAKCNFIADYTEEFLKANETSKLAIGFHHHSVRDTLLDYLESYGTCKLDGQDDPRTKDRIAHHYFETSKERVLLLGMMAAKEGLELVYVENALVAEREWTSTDEEQFEYRFYNPDLGYLKGRGLENKTTTIEYILAAGTIDSFFYEMVEEKRAIFGETLSKNWSLESDPMSFKQLMERTLASRL